MLIPSWIRYFVLALIVSLAIPTKPTTAKTILKMNHQFPSNAVGSRLDQWFADEVKKVTGGEVEIRIYWSNKLGEPKENLLLLRNNAINMTAMSAGYFPRELPLHSAPNSIPMGMDNVCQSSIIMKALLNKVPEFRQEAKSNGIRPLFFHLLNPYLLVTKKPVTKFSDLKGLRIRTWGKDMPRLMKAAGAIPVTLFLPDIYKALEHGVIDGCPFSTDLNVSYKIYEIAKNITEVVLWEGPSWGVWISEISWNKLSMDHQIAILKVAEEARKKEIPLTLDADTKSRTFLKSKGVAFHPFPRDQLAIWQERNPDFFNDLKLDLKKSGLEKPAKQMIDIWRSLRKIHMSCP